MQLYEAVMHQILLHAVHFTSREYHRLSKLEQQAEIDSALRDTNVFQKNI